MYISPRTALVRNVSASVVNGGITLIILLIAPLGLLSVIVNTLLVSIGTYTVIIAVDRVMMFLQRDQQAELLSRSSSRSRFRNKSELDRR